MLQNIYKLVNFLLRKRRRNLPKHELVKIVGGSRPAVGFGARTVEYPLTIAHCLSAVPHGTMISQTLLRVAVTLTNSCDMRPVFLPIPLPFVSKLADEVRRQPVQDLAAVRKAQAAAHQVKEQRNCDRAD